MPSIEKPDRSLLTGAVDDIISKKRRQKHEKSGSADAYDPGFLNILEFIDRFKLLPNGLYPVQRFILKMYYNIPLDDVLPPNPGDRIRIGKTFRKAGAIEVTEVEYLKYLFDNGRSNIAVQDFKPRRELILVLGRRSGKSMMSSIISAYELYKLIARGMPQAYYGMLPSAEIRVLCIANDKEQAEIVYGEIQNHVQHVDYFSSAVVKQTQSLMKFRTQGDAQRFKKDPNKGTISATFKSSIARGIRGRGCMACILDELAFFVDDGKSSAEQVYRAVNPSLKQFSPKDPKNRRQSIGPSDGRMICISSPDAKDGLFYKLYELSKTGSVASSQMLMIQAPTWEVNPTVDEADYEVERAKDPRGFETEYGAQFSDRVRGWIENAQDLLDCCIEGLKPLVRGAPREPFFAGGDLAISGDGTCISLTHILDGRIQLGYHETWCAGVPWEESNPHLQAPSTPYAATLATQKRLDVDEIVEWFFSLSRRFYIVSGLLDQAFGVIFEQKLHKKGLTQFECRRFSTSDSSDTYQNAKMLMFMRQLGLYNYPVPEQGEESVLTTARHSPHISEMLELQAASGGKNVVIVTKPSIPGKKDDFSDSLVRSLSLASNYVKENPSVLELSKLAAGAVPPRRQVAPSPYSQQRMKIRMHGLPPKERRVPASMRRR